MPTYTFTDFDRAVDRFHALCDEWAEDGAIPEVIGHDGLHVLRLAVHEWMANLIQHARYDGPREVRLDVDVEADAVRVAIEDTSRGFDFASQIERQAEILAAPAPSERGRGLLMLVSFAEDLQFRPVGEGGPQRIAFALRDPLKGDLGALFRPADLEPVESLLHEIDAGDIGTGDGLATEADPSPPVPAAPR